MSESSYFLTRNPSEGATPSYTESLAKEYYDLLRPSPWIQKALNLTGVPDPVTHILRPFVGNYDAAYQHGEAFANVGEAYINLADEVHYRGNNMASEGIWEGNAADIFSQRVSSTIGELRDFGEALYNLGNSYKDSSNDIYRYYIALREIVDAIVDLVCDVVACLAAPGKWNVAIERAVSGYPKVIQLMDFYSYRLPGAVDAVRSRLTAAAKALETTHVGRTLLVEHEVPVHASSPESRESSGSLMLGSVVNHIWSQITQDQGAAEFVAAPGVVSENAEVLGTVDEAAGLQTAEVIGSATGTDGKIATASSGATLGAGLRVVGDISRDAAGDDEREETVVTTQTPLSPKHNPYAGVKVADFGLPGGDGSGFITIKP